MGVVGVKFTETAQFTTTSCASCGIAFAIPADLDTRLRENHRGFFCPNGHSLFYEGKTEAQRLREELEQTRKDLGARLSAAHEEANKANAEAWRLKQRARGGMCPCCKRSFTALARHMKTKHPSFAGVATTTRAARGKGRP